MSKLPGAMRERQIKDMAFGESGFAVPWAMYADEDGDLFINGGYTVDEQSGGTCRMLITMGIGKILVKQYTISDEKYTPGQPNYFGDFTSIPADLI